MANIKKGIRVINTKERSYNGITKNMIVEITETECMEYLSAGFEVVKTNKENPETKTNEPDDKKD